MAGIGAIGGATPYTLAPPANTVSSIGRDPSGVLGTRAGLGETKSVAPDTGRPVDEDDKRSAGLRAGVRDLSEDEQEQVRELQRRDREVRRHEQAHVAAAGRYANGGPNLEFTTGPDGRQYASGGHVSIDVSPANTPEATLVEAQIIRRAALAPAEPSAQDRAVATAASKLESDARRQIRDAAQAEARGAGRGGEGVPADPAAPETTPAPDALQPPPALPRRDFPEYAQETGGGVSRVRRLDLRV